MKNASKILFFLCVIWFVGLIIALVLADYNYSRSIQSYWELGVRASTIEKKSAYLDQYMTALESTRLAGYDALWLKTPENSVAQNLVALRSLRDRLHEILKMNVSSFEYQQAMAQITGQEQDEGKNMLAVLEGAWYLEHHFFLWGWVVGLNFSLCFVVIGFAVYFSWEDDWYF